MLREEFVAALENVETMEEVTDLFQKEGIDLEALAEEAVEEVELSEEDLDDVAGGISTKQLGKLLLASAKRILNPKGWKGAVKATAKDSAILLVAYYDVLKHGDATHTFSKKTIEGAAKRFGLM